MYSPYASLVLLRNSKYLGRYDQRSKIAFCQKFLQKLAQVGKLACVCQVIYMHHMPVQSGKEIANAFRNIIKYR